MSDLHDDGTAMSVSDRRGLHLSFLVFSGTDSIMRLLSKIPGWLHDFAVRRGFTVTITIRINNPALDVAELRAQIASINKIHSLLRVVLIGGGANTGFGRGHNENYRSAPAEFLLVMNDDLDFPDLNWLPTAIDLFDKDDRLALIGDRSNPQMVSPFFGNGTFNIDSKAYPLRYAEASVLVVRGSAFEAIGMFDETFEWAMSEDSDLSLRAQQMGYRVDWMPIPHEHWRSTSFHSLPSYAKSSLKEHNRARFLAKWGYSLTAGRVGKTDLIDVYSAGMGDVFCALLHVDAEYRRLPEPLHRYKVINTSHPRLAKLMLPDSAQIEAETDFQSIIELHREDGVANIRSTRRINYAMPFNIHSLVSGALSLPLASQAAVDRVISRLRERSLAASESSVPQGEYCVVHVEFNQAANGEFNRAGHDGRGPSLATVQHMIRTACSQFENVVILGIRKQYTFEFLGGLQSKVIDLQAALDLPGLIATVLSAKAFVGIDSFPAHVAQAAGIPSAVFFGSVHPLTRVWDEKRTWPIVSDLACLGCYHEHIEPGAPYCMRRDNACTVQIAEAATEGAVASLKAAKPFDWTVLRKRFDALQAKWLHLLAYHPAPPAHFMRNTLPNETVSNIIYELTERIAAASGRHMQSRILEDLRTHNGVLKNNIYERDVVIQDLKEKLTTQSLSKQSTKFELADSIKSRQACSIANDEDWLLVKSMGNDPQIEFHPFLLKEGPFCISIFGLSETDTIMKLYWRHSGETFSEQRATSVHLTAYPKLLVLDRHLEPGRRIYLRLDPAETECEVRVRGHIAGPGIVSLATSGKTGLRAFWMRRRRDTVRLDS